MNPQHATLPILGWREWVALPDLGVSAIKAKIDTGAKTSSLHAFHIQRFRLQGRDFVRFEIHPRQKNHRNAIQAKAALLDYRTVRSSSGHETLRAVICTDLDLFGERHSIELTLANRDQMGFRMLLGREALKNRYLVNSAVSFLDATHRPKPRRTPRSEDTPGDV